MPWRRAEDHEQSGEEELEDRLHRLDRFVERCDEQPVTKLATVLALAIVTFFVGVLGVDCVVTGGIGPRVAVYRWLSGDDSPSRRPIDIGVHHRRRSWFNDDGSPPRGSFIVSNGPPTKIIGAAILGIAAILAQFTLGLAVPGSREFLHDTIKWTIGIIAALWFATIVISMAF